MGRSTIWLDPCTATVLASDDATRGGTGTRINDAIYPLHSGRVGGWAWQLAVALAGLLPSFLVVFWRARKRRHG